MRKEIFFVAVLILTSFRLASAQDLMSNDPGSRIPLKGLKFHLDINDGYQYEFDVPITRPQVAELFRIFEDRDFETLNKLFIEEQRAFENGETNEERMCTLEDLFYTKDSDDLNIANKWVDAYPDSFAPYLVRGTIYHHLGDRQRGGDYIKNTPERELKKAKHFYEKAMTDLIKALELSPENISARNKLINLNAKMGSRLEMYRLYAEGIKMFPDSFILRDTLSHYLYRRWGSLPMEMSLFLEETRKHYAENPRLRCFEGLSIWDKAREYSMEEKDEKVLEIIDDALAYGNHYKYLRTKAIALKSLQRYEEAIECFTLWLDQYPYTWSALLGRAECYNEIGRYTDALDDANFYLILYPGANNAMKIKRFCLEQIGG